jgi:hypothetical protein
VDVIAITTVETKIDIATVILGVTSVKEKQKLPWWPPVPPAKNGKGRRNSVDAISFVVLRGRVVSKKWLYLSFTKLNHSRKPKNTTPTILTNPQAQIYVNIFRIFETPAQERIRGPVALNPATKEFQPFQPFQ